MLCKRGIIKVITFSFAPLHLGNTNNCKINIEEDIILLKNKGVHIREEERSFIMLDYLGIDKKTIIAQKVSALIGKGIMSEDVMSDKDGIYYYIPAQSLKNPVVLEHYRGRLMMVLPVADCLEIEANNIDIDSYIQNSHWGFGYFRGGGSLIGGIKWKPFEITTKGKEINHFLNFWHCKVFQSVSGNTPGRVCLNCKLDTCSVSDYKRNGDAEMEYEIPDDRCKFWGLLKERLEQELKLKGIMLLPQAKKYITLYPSMGEREVQVYAPETMLIRLLDEPGKHDVRELVEGLEIKLGIPALDENHEEKIMRVDENSAFFCYSVWRDECPQLVARWFQ